MLPPSLAEWLPEGHLARFVIDVVEGLDLGSIHAAYRGEKGDRGGRPAHDPVMMVALLLYSYALGVRSSRAIERRCVEDVATRFITANRVPDHVTINRFRSRHQVALSDLFGQVLGLCARAGMVRVGLVAIDSTKLAANASLSENRTEEGLRKEAQRLAELEQKRLAEQAQRILVEAGATDEAEDRLFGDARGDELPPELADPATRAARVKALLDEAQAERDAAAAEQAAKCDAHEQAAREGRTRPGRPPRREVPADVQREISARKRNITDSESAIVKDRGRLIQGFNVQATVGEGQLILATKVTAIATDHGQLRAMIDAAHEQLGRAGIPGSIQEVLADSGYWNAELISVAQGAGIDVLVPPRESSKQHAADAMRAALAEPDAKARYKRRAAIAEPAFAHIKHRRQITQLLRRGLTAAQHEMDLIATTHNLLKLFRAAPQPA